MSGPGRPGYASENTLGSRVRRYAQVGGAVGVQAARIAGARLLGRPLDGSNAAELKEALSRGCAQSGDVLVAPSFVADFPAQLDAFETVILPPGTELYSENSEASAGNGAPDWHLARVTDDSDEAWFEVKLIDGREGFVRRDQIVNPLDYRLVFEKRDGKWLITAFVAGD